MGSPEDFYNGRGKNKPIYIDVVYKEGRKEEITVFTQKKANQTIDQLKAMGSVRSAKQRPRR